MTFRRNLLIFFAALLVGLLLMLTIAVFMGRIALPGGLFPRPAARVSRPPQVLYISPSIMSPAATTTPSIWSARPGSGSPRLLTHGTGVVADYSPSPDGEWVAFSAENNRGGADLWLVDRDGNRQHVLVRCDSDICSQLAWSPDSRQILFGRKPASVSPEPQVFPLPWLVDPSNGHVQRLDNDPLITYSGGTWSPDGRRLAFYDPNAKGIRVRDQSGGKEVVISSNALLPGSWSPDSQRLIFITEESAGDFTYMKVYQMDFASGKTSLLLGKQDNDASDYGLPKWSPDGQWLVYNLRTLSGNPAKQMRLMHPDGSGVKTITSDQASSSANYQWSPDSRAIVFQRFAFGSSENVPDVVLWSMDDGKFTLLAQDAALPQWLP